MTYLISSNKGLAGCSSVKMVVLLAVALSF